MVPGALMGGALAVGGRALGHDTDALIYAAAGAAGFSIGGVTTYGQTLGLMHNEPRPTTYWWGVLGCFLKGGLWFALGASFLGLVVAGHVFSLGHMLRLGLLASIAALIGKRLLNCPLQPPERYPLVYFSRRALIDLEKSPPRQESWGGLLLGLLAIAAYVQFVLGNPAVNAMALVGFIGGGAGFAVGEMIQAWGIWRKPLGDKAQPWMDWWKVMEMTFGLIGGAAIGLGYVWLGHDVGSGATVPGQNHLAGVTLTALWVVPILMAANGAILPERIWDAPVVLGMVMLAGISAGGATPVLLVWAVISYVSSVDTLQRWRRGLSRAAYGRWRVLLGLGGVCLAVVGLYAAPILASWPAAYVLMVSVTQTALTLVKALGEAKGDSLGHRMAAMRAAWPVEGSFVVLTLAVSALAASV